MKDGVEKKNMDIYAQIAKGNTGKNALRQAAVQNRAALMAEGIDFLDGNWINYYAVESSGEHTVFNSTEDDQQKTVSQTLSENHAGAGRSAVVCGAWNE